MELPQLVKFLTFEEIEELHQQYEYAECQCEKGHVRCAILPAGECGEPVAEEYEKRWQERFAAEPKN